MEGGGEAATSNATPDTFLGHFIAGIFLLSYGAFFLCLTAVRLVRIAQEISNDATCTSSISSTPSSVSAEFQRRHVPEQNPVLLRRVSVILLVSTTFGILYEGFGALYIDHDSHPDKTFFSDATHQTLTFAFFFAGFTGLLESWQLLPPDSVRGAVVLALLGEALLWLDHALMKEGGAVRIHILLALTAAFSAVSIFVSIVMSASTSTRTRDRVQGGGERTAAGCFEHLALLSYACGFLGFLWQGMWFMVAAQNEISSIAMDRIVMYYILQGIALGFGVEIFAAYLSCLSARHEDKNSSSGCQLKLAARQRNRFRFRREGAYSVIDVPGDGDDMA
eukprot:CAMPEP_0197715866 /NCGR_PEP_ID=MMETSP1434-20131217/943_1 /TAXON_ID=265543 /ORGANISM="Minutocellus polymorphus, Strain CCMP3303" /LENGTH=334 /DNA_ID=CAMNT_0043300115 /DNA_START=36 /DNA_END=1040 /DNA_ORIENTATION=-